MDDEIGAIQRYKQFKQEIFKSTGSQKQTEEAAKILLQESKNSKTPITQSPKEAA